MPAVADSVLAVIAAALADTVAALAGEADELANLQVLPFMLTNPTPPAVDVFPADPSQADAAFGPRSRQTFWTVRARVATNDIEAQQTVLLALMAPSGPTSVLRALLDDPTLDGAADGLNVDGPTGFRLYQTLGSPQGVQETHLGCEWRVTVYTPTGPTS